jgi:hypothetical protein
MSSSLFLLAAGAGVREKPTQAVSESGQFSEGAMLEKAIKANLKGLGYGG